MARILNLLGDFILRDQWETTMKNVFTKADNVDSGFHKNLNPGQLHVVWKTSWTFCKIYPSNSQPAAAASSWSLSNISSHATGMMSIKCSTFSTGAALVRIAIGHCVSLWAYKQTNHIVDIYKIFKRMLFACMEMLKVWWSEKTRLRSKYDHSDLQYHGNVQFFIT